MRTAAAWILAVFLSSGFAAVAGAQMTYDANYDSKIELKPTEAGLRLDAVGVAAQKVKDGVEEFAVRIVANAIDGARFEVTIETASGKFTVGDIRLILGSGVLALRSSVQPSEVVPVPRIQGVQVTFNGEVVLEGRFPGRVLGG
jgi:hypothetical protein